MSSARVSEESGAVSSWCTFWDATISDRDKCSDEVNDLINQFHLRTPTRQLPATRRQEKHLQRVEGTRVMAIIVSQYPNWETNSVCDFCHQPNNSHSCRSFFGCFKQTSTHRSDILMRWRGEQWHCGLCTQPGVSQRADRKPRASVKIVRRRKKRHIYSTNRVLRVFLSILN